MSLEYCGGVFSGQVYCELPWTWQEMKSGLFYKHYTLRDGMFSTFKESYVINS